RQTDRAGDGVAPGGVAALGDLRRERGMRGVGVLERGRFHLPGGDARGLDKGRQIEGGGLVLIARGAGGARYLRRRAAAGQPLGQARALVGAVVGIRRDAPFFVFFAGEVVLGVEGLGQRLAVGWVHLIEQILHAEVAREGHDVLRADRIRDGRLGVGVVG